jgi:hypothetical protein
MGGGKKKVGGVSMGLDRAIFVVEQSKIHREKKGADI